jgi:hypothetical protein
MAVLKLPVVFDLNATFPTAVKFVPVVLLRAASNPKAVTLPLVFVNPA